MDSHTLVPLEFCHIGQPLLVGFIRMEFTIEQVLGYVLRIPGPSCAAVAVILDGRLDALGSANPEYPLVVHMDAVVMPEVVIDAAVALVRAVSMDFLYLFGNGCILLLSLAGGSHCPFIVSGPGHAQQLAKRLNGIGFFKMAVPYGSV